MKWVGLLILVVGAMFLTWWLRRNPNSVPKALMLMGFLPFALGPLHLYMAAISWADWPGYVKGAEFSVLDAVALALYLGLRGPRFPLPFRISMGFYFVAALLSVFQAQLPLAALFYPWQLARMFLVYAAVAKACADPLGPPALLKGMGAGLVMEAGVAFWERFGLGVLQAGGTAGHQNLLGLMLHFAVFPLFALLLAGRPGGWLPLTGTLAGVVTQVLTTSRATVGLAGFGYLAVFVLSAIRRWSPRKAVVLLIGVALVAALIPLTLMSFERRFAAEGASNYDERSAFQAAAAMMISDHPLGVGANHYVIVANTGGYNARAAVAPVRGSGSANVHNVYLLVAAETGYLGLIAFVLLLLRPMMAALACGLRHRGDERGDLLIGIGVALLTVYIHSFFEWILITFEAQYMFALNVGLVAGLTQQLGYWRRFNPSIARLRVGASSIMPRRHLVNDKR